MSAYHYNIHDDFPNHRVLPSMLRGEIVACVGVTTEITDIATHGDGVADLYFVADLSPAEKSALDGIVAVHAGYTVYPEFITNTPIVADIANITTQDWQTLGGVVSNVSFFCPAEQAYGELLGSAKVSGSGAQVRAVEEGTSGEGGTVVIAGPFDIASVDWSEMRFNSYGRVPRSGSRCYRIEGRLNGAASASIRYTSLTLFQLIHVLGVME